MMVSTSNLLTRTPMGYRLSTGFSAPHELQNGSSEWRMALHCGHSSNNCEPQAGQAYAASASGAASCGTTVFLTVRRVQNKYLRGPRRIGYSQTGQRNAS